MKINQRIKRIKKYLSVLLILVLLLCRIPGSIGVNAARLTPQKPSGSDWNHVSWDCVWFGNYYQNKNLTEKTPIKWRVLDTDSESMLLLADKALTARAFHDRKPSGKLDFADSSLAAWLNSDFSQTAFSADELSSMEVMEGSGGRKVSLLSKEEAGKPGYGFENNSGSDSKTRRCLPTDHAIDQGVWISNFDSQQGACEWLLLDTTEQGVAEITASGGIVDMENQFFDSNYTESSYGIRPLIRVKFSDMHWSLAGSVCSDGSVQEIAPEIPEEGSYLVGDENSFTTEHVDFVKSSLYKEQMAKGYNHLIQEAMTTDSKQFASIIYKILTTVSDLSKCKKLSVFENPYDPVLLDLILSQGGTEKANFELNLQSKQKEIGQTLYETLQDAYKTEYEVEQGTWQPTSEYKTYFEQLLVEQPENIKEENPVFYEQINAVLGDYFKNDENLNKFLGQLGKAGTLVHAISDYTKVVDWAIYSGNYTAAVNAYLASSKEFKFSLKWPLMDTSVYDPLDKKIYLGYYEAALDKYEKFEEESLTEEDIALMLTEEYTSYGSEKIQDVFGPVVAKHATAYVTEGLGLTKAQCAWVFAVIESYNAGMALGDLMTGNDEIMDYRTSMACWYQLGNSMEKLAKSTGDNLIKNPAYKYAKQFDAAYSIYQTCQIQVMDYYQKYLDLYTFDKQISDRPTIQGFLTRIFRKGTYDSILEDRQLILKYLAEWKDASCHGRSSSGQKDITVVEVECPVDVSVYDTSGNPALMIRNDQLTFRAPEVASHICDDQKYFALPDRARYRIIISASGSGKMDYREICFTDSDRQLRITGYSDIPLQDGDEFEATSDQGGKNQKLIRSGSGEILTPKIRKSYREQDFIKQDSVRPIPVSSIKLSGISKKIAAGKKIRLKATVLPVNADNKKIIWKVNNTKLASVSTSGLVKIKKKKTANKTVKVIATARDGSGVKAVWKIRIMKGAVKKIKIKGAKKKLKVGRTMKLRAVVKTTKGKANKKIRWISSNKEWASVSSSGKVKASKAGKGKTVTITASATDGSGIRKSVKIKIR